MGVIPRKNTIPGASKRAYLKAGAPVNDTTFVGEAKIGDELRDTTNGILYIATVADATHVTWTKVGTQA